MVHVLKTRLVLTILASALLAACNTPTPTPSASETVDASSPPRPLLGAGMVFPQPGDAGTVLTSGGPTSIPHWGVQTVSYLDASALGPGAGGQLIATSDAGAVVWSVTPGDAGLPLLSNGPGLVPGYGQLGASAISPGSAGQVLHTNAADASAWAYSGQVVATQLPGIDPAGASDSTTGIDNATASAAAGGWTLFFPAGTYLVNSTPSIAGGARILIGPGVLFTGSYAYILQAYAGGGVGYASPPSLSAATTPYSLLAFAAGWYDANNASASVSSWPDQSGNGNTLTQANGSYQPTLNTGGQGGRSYFHFNGSDAMCGGPTVTPPFTIWAVARTSGGAGTQTIAALGGANLFARDTSSGTISFYANGFITSGLTATSVSSIYDFASTYSTNQGFRSNGVTTLPQSVAGSNYAPGNCIGSTASGPASNGLTGDIYEWAVWSSVLTAPQLAQLDAYAAAKYQLATTNLLIADGNSFVAGNGASGAAHYLGQQVLNLLGSSFGTTYINNGVGGETTPNMLTYAQAHSFPLVTSKLVPFTAEMGIEGTNDIYYGATAAQAYADTVTFCQTAHQAGSTCFITTILSRSNAGTPANFNTTRATYNALLRANWPTFADGLADWASDARMGGNGVESNATYFSGDLVHPNDTGYTILAGYLASSIQAYMSRVGALSSVALTGDTTGTGGNTIATTTSRLANGAVLASSTELQPATTNTTALGDDTHAYAASFINNVDSDTTNTTLRIGANNAAVTVINSTSGDYFQLGGTNELILTSGQLVPGSAGLISYGTSSLPFGAAYFGAGNGGYTTFAAIGGTHNSQDNIFQTSTYDVETTSISFGGYSAQTYLIAAHHGLRLECHTTGRIVTPGSGGSFWTASADHTFSCTEAASIGWTGSTLYANNAWYGACDCSGGTCTSVSSPTNPLITLSPTVAGSGTGTLTVQFSLYNDGSTTKPVVDVISRCFIEDN